MLSSLTDTELLALCRQHNDQLAFRVFYDRHWPDLYRTAHHKLQRADIAEELIQDLFVKI
ncbi:MAG: RNA polymerase sigma-70 factor, partial [Bacteroidetes bacterium]|nr:RNA polymerase sigma-70 factor [Fibrella sp.]